ncbi:MAG: beta-propeller domain-containing protein [Deltaproteobacteria bacterium]|nr:beta-propeller domain-containing protein [Deltaproteobacteria bacterium]
MPRRTIDSQCSNRAAAALVLVVAAACAGRDPPVAPEPPPPDDAGPPPEAPRYVSADPSGGIAAPYNYDDALTPDLGGTDPYFQPRGALSVQLDNGLLATLTRFRGLQLLDLSDPDAPRVVATLPVTGWQAALYARGTRLFVLSNFSVPITDAERSPAVNMGFHASVTVIDVADPSAPTVVERLDLPGNLLASRVLTSVDRATLYLAYNGARGEAVGQPGAWTSLSTFDLSAGALTPVDVLDLPGAASGVRFEPGTSLVAVPGRVTLVDSSDPAGTMAQRGNANVAGRPWGASSMDLFHGVLRVLSHATEPAGAMDPIFALQTIDATDPDALAPIERFDFGRNEELKTILFLGNKAFAVTYWVQEYVDPLHIFALYDDGTIVARPEVMEQGWNRRLVPVLGDTRLVGVGVSSEFSGTPTVSLYDAYDLSNPSPMLARVEVEVGNATSDATWDADASTVLEGAVSVPSPSGEATETGLVLLPFQAYDGANQRYVTGTQLFTFSATTLTRRGLLQHGTPVRRAFPVAGGLTATLSDAGLSLFDAAVLDQPVARGHVDLAENYVDWLPLRNGASARVVDGSDYWHWWWGEHAPMAPGRIDVLAPSADPNDATPLASIEYPAEAVVFATGSTLVAVDGRVMPGAYESDPMESHLAVFDLSDPAAPELARTLTSTRLPVLRAPPPEDWGCAACVRVPYAPSPDVHALPGALVFVSRPEASASIGQVRNCRYWADNEEHCEGQGLQRVCQRYAGQLECVRPLDVEEETCRGAISFCEGAGYDPVTWQCDEVDPTEVELHRDCYENEGSRRWHRLTLEILDVRDPRGAALIGPVDLPEDAVAGSVTVEGSTLWASIATVEDVPNDMWAWLRWFAVPIDLTDPSAPVMGEPINTPGDLLLIDGDTALTRDWHRGDGRIDGSVNQSTLDRAGAAAALRRTHLFAGRDVGSALPDEAGHLLVDHDATFTDEPSAARISVLDEDLELQATFGLQRRAPLRVAGAGRVLAKVDYEVLVLNLDDPAAPFAQAAFPIRDWPASARVQDHDLVIPGGRYGIYRFDLDFENLPWTAPSP